MSANEKAVAAAAKYVPVLPEVKARALPVDPKKGYLVQEVKPGVFVITDGAYQSAFVTTGQGVILLDAPPTFAQHIQQAVADVTREPIRQIVYSHAHLDHIAGTEFLLKKIPDLEIIAERGGSDFLNEKNDRRRPIPTTTFADEQTLTVGSARIELRRGNWHSNEGDLFISIPDKKFLMAVDTIAAGHVQFMDFDLSTNFHKYLKVFDELLAYDFDIFVPGHLTCLMGLFSGPIRARLRWLAMRDAERDKPLGGRDAVLNKRCAAPPQPGPGDPLPMGKQRPCWLSSWG